ncbi:hypothetical protein [Flectobacillus rivi]|uniref:Transcription elongation factor GreA/GreB C-terminal domain-containing protein n=1 Tax=Flectobacillus rivi TaxID=2984209 RepID=A0ABT6YWL2_9BACT|nr:hypothetical protein [Flectobacillus rivi]MDI9873097.1 hypothetical protein [Flectobacillus rivi]
MEKLTIKKQLFEKAIQQQQTLVRDIQKRLSDLKESITSLEVGSFGGSDDARREEDVEDIQQEKIHLANAKAELNKLEALFRDVQIDAKVGVGSIVKTEQFNFVFAINMPQIELNNERFMLVSDQAPVFKALEGKTVGEQAQINRHYYTIKEIF